MYLCLNFNNSKYFQLQSVNQILSQTKSTAKVLAKNLFLEATIKKAYVDFPAWLIL